MIFKNVFYIILYYPFTLVVLFFNISKSLQQDLFGIRFGSVSHGEVKVGLKQLILNSKRRSNYNYSLYVTNIN